MPRRRLVKPLLWCPEQIRALSLVFEGRKKLDDIAKEVGVDPRTLDNWIATPEWKARLQQKREHLMEALDGVAYVRKESRIMALSQTAEQARLEFEARPLLVERRPTGHDPETGEVLIMEQEMFNKDAFESFRGALADIAKELGDRTTTVKVSASLDINILAADADARFHTFVTAESAFPLLGEPDAGAKG
jgi:transposase-like protein